MDIPEGRLEITFHFGMSMASDYDNPVKIFQDVLSKKYGFNDNRIFAHKIKLSPCCFFNFIAQNWT
jgi:hypothetical protein